MSGMYREDEYILLSALQHYQFCPRQCALIHLEQIWVENRATAAGRVFHRTAHGGGGVSRPGVRIARSLPLGSSRLGLSGEADVVEFHSRRDGSGVKRVPFPVEYKSGGKKGDGNLADKVQLCAQALCLEEMLSVAVPEGALFYGKNRRREPVLFDAELRRHTEAVIAAAHALLASGVTPAAAPVPACAFCSLQTVCLPGQSSASGCVGRYLASLRHDNDGDRT